MTRPSDTPSINDLSLLDAALEYAGRGWHVFPVQPGGKAPHRAVGQGYKDATCEEAQIRRWWTNDPDANIGLALAPSGLVALDVDSYKDEAAWETFKAKISIPETFRQRTAGGAPIMCSPASRAHPTQAASLDARGILNTTATS
jgi:hypothetical protein